MVMHKVGAPFVFALVTLSKEIPNPKRAGSLYVTLVWMDELPSMVDFISYVGLLVRIL